MSLRWIHFCCTYWQLGTGRLQKTSTVSQHQVAAAPSLCLLIPPAQFQPVHSPSFALQLRKQLSCLCRRLGHLRHSWNTCAGCSPSVQHIGLTNHLEGEEGKKQQHVFTNFQLGMCGLFYLIRFVMETFAFGDVNLPTLGPPVSTPSHPVWCLHSAAVGVLIDRAAK